MSEHATIWRQTADKWTEVADLVTDDDWSKPTTCDGFTVRELVDHAMHWQATGGGVIGAGTKPGDPWSDVHPALSAALDDPSNLEGAAEAFGGMPKHQMLGMLTTDLLVHSWDLARSIGADDTLPSDAVDAAMIGLGRMPEEMLRSDGMFAPAVSVPDSATAQDKFIAFTGRHP